ncbi:MAG: metallophosphoesterase family protein [Candidatus Hodarchaeales archaeon]|jgi:putative phosphoesterase
MLAVISDIHSNIVALDAVLRDIQVQFPEVTKILCPGDVVGYGPNPIEVIDRIISDKRISVVTKGNHDNAVGIGWRDISNYVTYLVNFKVYAQATIKWTLKELSTEYKDFLYQLPSSRTLTIEGLNQRIAVIHGSPSYPLDEYIHPNTQAQKDLFPLMEMFGLDVLCLGHTHKPFIDKEFKENGQEMLMVNPGSVGQPRDNDPRASYAIITIDDFSAEIVKVDYDIDDVYQRILKSGLPSIIGKRLYEGH